MLLRHKNVTSGQVYWTVAGNRERNTLVLGRSLWEPRAAIARGDTLVPAAKMEQRGKNTSRRYVRIKRQVDARAQMREHRARDEAVREVQKDEKKRVKHEKMLARVRAIRDMERQRQRANSGEGQESAAIAVAAARRRRRACKEIVDLTEMHVAYLSHGRDMGLDAFEQRFRTRHGRAPTAEEETNKLPVALADERYALRASRHEYAAATAAVLDAERLIILREARLAKTHLRQLLREQLNGEDDQDDARARARAKKHVLDQEHALKKHDRHCKHARDKEAFWPQAHWQRNAEGRPLPDDDVRDEDADDEAVEVRYLERDVPFVDSSRIAFEEIVHGPARAGAAGRASRGRLSGRSSGSMSGRSGTSTGMPSVRV